MLCLAGLAAGGSAVAAVGGPSTEPSEQAAASALARPALVGPANEATVSSIPAFSWRPVRRAVRYEFQLSADARFRSTLASFDTLNSSASVDKTLFDGNYHWRVRAIDANKTAGRWSRVRTIRKRWSDQPQLLAPAAGAEISYPTMPLVLRWTPTPHAVKYEVTISADPGLAGKRRDRRWQAVCGVGHVALSARRPSARAPTTGPSRRWTPAG